MAVDFVNFYESTLSGPITNTDLVVPINVTPSVNEGWLLIDYDVPSKREFVYFTSKNSTTVTVPSSGGRGQDGTTAIAHTQNAKVRMNVNAGILKGLRDGTALGPLGTASIADNAITPAKMALTTTVDANGWTVRDYGDWKEYTILTSNQSFTKNQYESTASGSINLPVGTNSSAFTNNVQLTTFDSTFSEFTTCLPRFPTSSTFSVLWLALRSGSTNYNLRWYVRLVA